MRTYRIFTMLALLATIGSFVVELWMATKSGEPSDQSPGRVTRQSPEEKGDPPLASEARSQHSEKCDLQFYRAIKQRLRSEKGRYQEAAAADRFERLGEDRGHIYFYDRAADEIFCVPHDREKEPVVLSNRPDPDEGRRYNVVFWCVAVMVLAGVALVATQVSRVRQAQNAAHAAYPKRPRAARSNRTY